MSFLKFLLDVCVIINFLGALLLENAMLDISPEDAVDLNKKRRMLRWDAKKKKFVKVKCHFLLSYPIFLILYAKK